MPVLVWYVLAALMGDVDFTAVAEAKWIGLPIHWDATVFSILGAGNGGMISAVGVRNVVESQVDFAKSRNVIIAARILVLSIGINYSTAGAVAFTIGTVTISLSGLAVGALVGIMLNAVLPGKDYKFEE